ncbi:tRNA lysidine(34) synthetase TilS [Mechercharimyces sp. CAU 1602]|uniref:tRNA lysidine(34) synthetase TilS n=1 Tax=Mechercharimyces sp. CAU 1602 TaxID=2973933 RepID=UPI00216259BF|nr:tRNA lysidine(34) synthetase TilS [Mechercharimyces sp. CAU 1602]MCS1352392.1 tRNA lysidine(34) synthetase TilS [Mechercharimyces sp. CAU 1602]
MVRDVVAQQIEVHDWIDEGELILVAVSGGADSMALLHILHTLSPRFSCRLLAVHIDHQLRGSESDEDANYVLEQCKRWGIDCHTEKISVRDVLATEKGNLQDTARQLRYEAFVKIAKQTGATKLAVAHHADDQVETIIMRLLRGTGVAGLQGIPVTRSLPPVTVIRPLLGVERSHIEQYCEQEGIMPRQDSSNQSLKYTRNRIRQQVVPLLQQMEPRVKEHLISLAEMVSKEEEAWRLYVEQAKKDVVVTEEAGRVVLACEQLLLLPLALQRRLIKLILKCLSSSTEQEETFTAITQTLYLAQHAEPSVSVDLAGGVVARRQYQLLVIEMKKQAPQRESVESVVRIPIPGTIKLPTFAGELTVIITEKKIESLQNTSSYYAVFDRAYLREPVVVRSRRTGDRMRPWGVNGTKKVKDMLIDAKIPVTIRDRVPIVCHGETIIWIPGVRRSDWAPVTTLSDELVMLIWEEEAHV